MRRKLLLVAGALVGLWLLAWVVLISWVNGESARAALEARIEAESGLDVVLEELGVSWLGSVRLHGLTVKDPRKGGFLSLPRILVDWQLPFGNRSLLLAAVEGGRIEVREARWKGYRFGAGPRPTKAVKVHPLPGARPGLQTAGTMEVPAEPLVSFQCKGLTADVGLSSIAAEYRIEGIAGKGAWLRGDTLRVENLQARLAGTIPLVLRGKFHARGGEAELELQRSQLAEIGSLMPLSALVLQLGAILEGGMDARLRLRWERGRPLALKGSLGLDGAGIRLGGEPMLRELKGQWNFEGSGASGVAGDVRLEKAAATVFGLPLSVEAAGGRMEVKGGQLRLSRLKGRTPFGPARAGYRARWGQYGPEWVLTLDTGGAEGSWLQGATIEIDPSVCRMQGVHLVGEGLDLLLDARVLPEGVDPPTWKVENAVCVGSAKSRPLRLEGLEGILYLDNQGGYSFNLEGSGNTLRGQVGPDRSLRLWVRPADRGTFDAYQLAPGN